MKITITTHRSKRWVLAQRIARGDNVPEWIDTQIEAAELSEASRKTILMSTWDNSWPIRPYDGADFDCDREIADSSVVGREELLVDSHHPTAAEIDGAIQAAAAKVAAHRVSWLKKQADAKADAERAAAEMARAEELLGPTIAQLRQEAEEWKADRDTLGKFLAQIPDDALRGTLRKMTEAPAERKRLEEKIEDASPYVIFGDEPDVE